MKYSTKAARLIMPAHGHCDGFRGGRRRGGAGHGKESLVTGRQMGSSDIPTLDPSLMQDVPSVQVGIGILPRFAQHE